MKDELWETPSDESEFDRLVSAKTTDEFEEKVELTLRPQKLAEFIGQEHIKAALGIGLAAAKKRLEPLEHILLYGNPGLGKTTLAHIIAREMGGLIKVTSGPALERVGDLAAILSNLKNGDILFIDEIHRLNKTVEEVLYSAMEDFVLDVVIGKGPAARTLRLPLERFTLIGATTKLNLVAAPLRDRFGHVFHLTFYEPTEIATIVNRSAELLNITIDTTAGQLIAERSRRTPRVANRLLKRARDYAEIEADGILNTITATAALQLLNIDHQGLDEVDRKILLSIMTTFAGGPVGLNTLAAAVAEDMETLEDIYEPYLLQIGFIERTPRGRKATPLAYQHLGKETPRQSP